MIKRLYKLWPSSGILARLTLLHTFLAILQGLLLGLLFPILKALLKAKPDFGEAEPWLKIGAVGLIIYLIITAIALPIGFDASMKLSAQLRHHLMTHVTRLPLGWFTGNNKTKLARILTADVGKIGTLAVTIGAPAITSVLVPITIIFITFIFNWQIALIFLAILPFAYFTLQRAARVSSEAEIELDDAATEIAGRAIELGQAQPVLRAAGQGVTGTYRMRHALEEHHRVYKKGLGRSAVPDLMYTGVVMSGFIIVLIFGSFQLINGRILIAEAVALLILAVRFLEPLGALIELIGALRAMDNSIARVQSILDINSLPKPANPVLEIKNSSILFSDVTFSYEGKTTTLTDISFSCPPGSTTALVGPSGSGKTTIIRLIARFYDINSGSIRIGGVDVRDYDNEVLLNDIAIIFQDVYLFDASIEENLLIAKPNATRAELEIAATDACLHEVISRLPNGWNSKVGEAGAQLSGGERQRVSIARAFLKKSKIILIDEASSALDPENERSIAQAINNLAKDSTRTVIVIAHRPTTLAAADQVVSLDNGKVVELGSPEALRTSDGSFAKLFQQYEKARDWHM
ncbi:ABC transporter ATP-binding protein [Pedobacter sp. ISL-68]|uniref:ABC transporter ATP-binding protein n=1 Tax=unclassified Pedobacter TaxID=2628915 RepID=UPI001BEAC1F6|nr:MULTISPECIES: ABC transporter ATP-binding protein [unclassified Pedobacter]MBT2564681.1 ABC transporter ATP-binding protein [Pedobacter sp. ISL-64]MBT2592430.1 ABC transporter ATP-binding protein [Pedobacter sp. ISL-68]